MKKIKAFLLASTAFVALSLSSCNPQNSQKDKATYTVMIYMCASTLESDPLEEVGIGAATLDLAELCTCNIPDNVKVIVRTGGTKQWSSYAKSEFGILDNCIQTFRIKNHTLIEDASQRTSYTDSTGRTMSQKDELEYFVNNCNLNHKSSKNALILWNHGGGMQGVCQDTHFSDDASDTLTNSEVNEALNVFSGDNKLEWIGYDACLMAVQDVADFNSAHAKYMIASQENEPGNGWAYDEWLPTLCSTPSMNTPELLKKITDTYISANKFSNYTTMSVLDLSKAETYRTAWETAASTLTSTITDKDKFNTFATIFNNGLKFGKTKGIYPFNVFDVNSFINKIKGTYSAFANISLDNYVIYNKYGSAYTSNLGYPSGLSMFCPILPLIPEQYYLESETNFTNWRTICHNGNYYTE